MARSRAFYEGVLGVKLTMDHALEDGRWVEYDIGGGTLALGQSAGMIPSRTAAVFLSKLKILTRR